MARDCSVVWAVSDGTVFASPDTGGNFRANLQRDPRCVGDLSEVRVRGIQAGGAEQLFQVSRPAVAETNSPCQKGVGTLRRIGPDAAVSLRTKAPRVSSCPVQRAYPPIAKVSLCS